MDEKPLNARKAKRLRYKVEYFPNPVMVCVHTNINFGHDIITVGSSTLGFSSYGEKREPTQALKHIGEVDGVLGAYTQDFRIHIERGEVFRWDEIIPAIEAIMNLELNKSEEEPEKLADIKRTMNNSSYGARSLADDDYPDSLD